MPRERKGEMKERKVKSERPSKRLGFRNKSLWGRSRCYGLEDECKQKMPSISLQSDFRNYKKRKFRCVRYDNFLSVPCIQCNVLFSSLFLFIYLSIHLFISSQIFDLARCIGLTKITGNTQRLVPVTTYQAKHPTQKCFYCQSSLAKHGTLEHAFFSMLDLFLVSKHFSNRNSDRTQPHMYQIRTSY